MPKRASSRARSSFWRPTGADRGDVPKQLGLLPERFEVGEAVGPIGDGGGEMGEHDARVVGVPRDAAVGHRHRHRLCQPDPIGQLAQQGGAGVRDEILAVGGTSNRRTERLLCTFKEASSRVVWLP
jgi:hypothetical protein